MNFALTLTGILALLATQGCGKSDENTDIEEAGQQLGDVMASIDESGGSSGSLAQLEWDSRKVFARHAPGDLVDSGWLDAFLPRAHAATCYGSSTFSSCSSNAITRTFGGCTIGSATFSGTVELTWSDASVDNTCQMAASGHSVTRVPNFTVTGRRGATLSVSKTGSVGQRITRGASAGSFTFSNDGIRRVFTGAGGATLFDYTTSTTSDITVTGASRASRVLNGGTLRVANNLNGVSCDLSPSSVSWTSSCNCPSSGSWSGSCSDGNSFSISITGCGSANLTLGEESSSVLFDRCHAI